MRATGIVRRVEDMGRIVIPRMIREQLDINEGDPMELFIEGNSVIFKKYNSSELSPPSADEYE
jgi:transcriptional pleiotropic regulator of transition state genes